MTTCQNHLHELVGQVYQIEEMLNGQKTFRGAERPLEIAEPKKLIEESIQLMPAALREKVRIIVDSRLEKLRPIRVHRVVFLQVVENLLINAAESIRRAKPLYPKICVRGVIEESDSIEMLHLEIQDNGAGIETEKLSSIFEGGNSSKPRGLTGIGLHWCANTISAMKGKIWAHSDGPGKGACFHILLPVSQEREMLTIKERRYTDE
jgi:signal transduction histidine kinase